MRLVISHPRRGWGGAATVAGGLAAGLAGRGHDVTLFCHPRGPLVDRMDAAVRVLPIIRGADLPVLPALRCAAHLRRLGVEAAVCTHPLDATFTVAGAALAGVPVALHRPSMASRVRGPVHRWMERRAVRVHVAPSRAVRRAVLEEREGADGVAVEVVHNGIDPERFTRAEPADLGLPEDALTVGYVGRIAREKGTDVLGRAWPAVERGHPTAHLVVVGDGRPEAEAEFRRALGGASRVRWLGYREDVAAVMAALDLAVVPSRSEALGLAAIEAMAAGLPVICTEVGGLPEVVTHGRDGMIVPAEAPEALGAAILELLGDAGRRSRMGEEAARTARRFSTEAMVEGYERILERIAASGP